MTSRVKIKAIFVKSCKRFTDSVEQSPFEKLTATHLAKELYCYETPRFIIVFTTSHQRSL